MSHKQVKPSQGPGLRFAAAAANAGHRDARFLPKH